MKFRFFGGVVVLVGLLASLAGCGGGSASGGNQVAATTAAGATLLYVVVTPEPVPVLPLGGSQQFVATGYYSDGTTQNLSSSASWTSSSTATATISASGLATAVAVGATNITATAGSIISLPVRLSTMQAKLVSVTISSTNSSIAVGQPTQFTAQGTYSNGFTQNITPAVDWYSGTASVAKIQTYITPMPGLATGKKPGTTVIYATDPLTGKSSATFSLTVTNTYAVGGTTSLLPAGASVTLLDTIVTAGVTTTDTVTINANGSFTLATALVPGANYNVTVSSASLGGAHTCTVLDGAGTINATTPAAALNLQLVCGPAVGTLAGSSTGLTGDVNGIGQSALFQNPRGVAVNTLTGDVYVADSMNNNIRAISPAGVVTTLAGSTTGVAGYADNTTGPLATFRGPDGLAFDPTMGTAGTLYVADSSNCVIRKIDIATAMVTTLAGSGSWGSANGTGAAASFNYPSGLAVDSSHNVYVADTSNNSIRKITSGGTVSTLAGSLYGGIFNGPLGVTVNSTTGVVYVADSGNNVIKTISGTTVSVLAGRTLQSGWVDGIGTDSLFYDPAHLAIDAAGNVYVADDRNGALRKVTPAGVVTTVAGHGFGEPVDGPISVAVFSQPWGIAVDAAGDVYMTDLAVANVRKYTP